jgi:uncharacterized MAPEG superfamily protein
MTGRIEPALVAYAMTSIVLSLNLIALWGYSGAVRVKSGVMVNAEDAARFGAQLAPSDPPAVARVLRAHGNAQAVIYPFLVMGLVFVLAGGGVLTASVIFAVFTVARLGHSIAYLAAKQPWRTLFFVVSFIATFALMVSLISRLIAA